MMVGGVEGDAAAAGTVLAGVEAGSPTSPWHAVSTLQCLLSGQSDSPAVLVGGWYTCGGWVVYVWWVGGIRVMGGWYTCGGWVVYVWWVGGIRMVGG